jgi:hypothetical protein
MTAAKHCLLLLATGAVAGCSSAVASRGAIELGPNDGPLWVAPEDVERYQCSQGLFVCQGGIGRTSDRLCQCVKN